MVYAFYHKRTSKVFFGTNLKTIERKSGIKYHKLVYWFNNGTVVKETEEFIILKGELLKGNQRAPQSSPGFSSSDKPESFEEELLK